MYITREQEAQIEKLLVWDLNPELKDKYRFSVYPTGVFLYKKNKNIIRISSTGHWTTKNWSPKNQEILGEKIQQIIKIIRPNSINFILEE